MKIFQVGDRVRIARDIPDTIVRFLEALHRPRTVKEIGIGRTGIITARAEGNGAALGYQWVVTADGGGEEYYCKTAELEPLEPEYMTREEREEVAA